MRSRLTDPNHIFHQPLQKNKHSQIAAHSRAKSCALPLLIQKLIPQWQICKVFKQERDEFEKRLRQSQKLESIGTLAGGIAHDFNNILSAVLGYTELALEEVDKGPGWQRICEKFTELEFGQEIWLNRYWPLLGKGKKNSDRPR